MKFKVAGGIVGAIFLFGFLSIAFSHAQVNAGEVGVVSHWGAIDPKEQPLQPGWHWIAPFSGIGITSVEVKQLNHAFKEVSTGSREQQNVFVDGAINYHITAAEAPGIQINGGIEAYIDRTFNPAFQDYIKEVIPQYTTVPGDKDNVLQNRPQIRAKVLEALRKKAQDPAVNYHITVDDVFLTDIHYDPSYTKAIEQAAVAQQQLAQAQIDAKTAAAKAQGTADAQRIQAQADHDANALRQQNLTSDLNEYLMIQKWNGVLPQVTGGGGVFTTINPTLGPK